jgi:acyl carrier protein
MDASKALEVVRAVAKRLNLLGPDGKLAQLDSLGIIDMVMELEAQTRIQIPTASLRQESFESLETIAALLDDLSA